MLKKILFIIFIIAFNINIIAAPVESATSKTTKSPKKPGVRYAINGAPIPVSKKLLKGDGKQTGVLSIKTFKNKTKDYLGLCIDEKTPYNGNATYYRNDAKTATNKQIKALIYTLGKKTDNNDNILKIVIAQFYGWNYTIADIDEIFLKNCNIDILKDSSKILNCSGKTTERQLKEFVSNTYKEIDNSGGGTFGNIASRNVHVWSPIPGCTGQEFISFYEGSEAESLEVDMVCRSGDNDDGDCKPPKICDDPCKPRITVDVAGKCEGFGQYNDKEDWSCLINDPDKNFLDNTGLSENNPYCQIYCKENLISEFPRNNFMFNAGTFFTLNKTWDKSILDSSNYMLTPIYFTGTRHCRMYTDINGTKEGIDTKKAVNKFNALASETARLYNEWQTAIKQNAAVDSATRKTSGEECKEYRAIGHELVKEGSCTEKKDEWGNMVCVAGTWKDAQYKELDCDTGFFKEGGMCVRKMGYRPYNDIKYLESTEGGEENRSISGSCVEFSRFDIGAAEAAYLNNLNQMEQVKNYINECSMMESKYNLNPDVSINIDMPGYNVNEKLKTEISPMLDEQSSTVIAPINGGSNGNLGVSSKGSCNGLDCTFKYSVCNSKFCRTNSENEKTISNANVNAKNKFINVTVNYSMNDFKNRFLIKSSGMVLESEPQHLVGTGTTINTEGKVVPISYYTKTGVYPYTLTYSKVGNIKNSTAHFDAELGKKESIPANYTCDINIENDIIDQGNCTKENCPDPDGGLNVIYRKINLGNKVVSFPGMDGKGREPGSNWSDENITNYIENNRGVKGDEVFSKTPIYSFKLTPKDIRDLKKYNRLVGAYNDVNYTCQDGYKCQSRLLRQPITINKVDPGESNATNSIHSFNFSSLMSGTCMTHDRNSFDSCRK